MKVQARPNAHSAMQINAPAWGGCSPALKWSSVYLVEKKLVKPGRLNMHADKILLDTRGEVKLSCPVQERWFDEPMNSNAFLGIPLARLYPNNPSSSLSLSRSRALSLSLLCIYVYIYI